MVEMCKGVKKKLYREYQAIQDEVMERDVTRGKPLLKQMDSLSRKVNRGYGRE